MCACDSNDHLPCNGMSDASDGEADKTAEEKAASECVSSRNQADMDRDFLFFPVQGELGRRAGGTLQFNSGYPVI